VRLYQLRDFFKLRQSRFVFLIMKVRFLQEVSGKFLQGLVLHDSADSFVPRMGLADIFGSCY
jgi:hypothetical protein